MTCELHVTAAVTTAPTLDGITVDNTLFVTTDPDGSMGRVYWKGRRVTDITVQAVARGSLVAIVEFEGQQVELGAAETTFVYDGQSLARPFIDGYLTGWTVTLDETSDTITAE
jgi:hypothetical protein